MLSWLLWFLFFTENSKAACPHDPAARLCGPENVNVIFDVKSWTIFTTWDDAAPSGTSEGLFYDVEVLYTDDLKNLHSEAIAVRSDQTGYQHQWSWRSPLPLECTTHAVRLRSRHLNQTSQWSPLQVNPGKTATSRPEMVPMDPRVEVGRNLTLCCLTTYEETVKMDFNGTRTVTRIGNHSYTITVDIQEALPYCTMSASCRTTKLQVGSTCVYAGYPPDDRDLECETRDMKSVECHWDIGRPTKMVIHRKTTYKLNGRSCPEKGKTTSNCIQTVNVTQGETTWTLEATNPLGVIKIKQRADLMKRVWMLAPVNMVASKVSARDARLDWQWEPLKYKTLNILCQVQLEHSGHVEVRNYSGPGLVSVVVTGLTPAQTYTVKVRCGTGKHFWKWGDNSMHSTFQTRGDIPDALDMWIHTEQNQTIIAWNTLLANQSHGQILDYEVVWGKSLDQSRKRSIAYSSSRLNYYTLPFVASGEEHVVTVTARNLHGSSPPSSLTFPSRFPDGMVTTKVFGSGGGFDLTWNASVSASCGYVVDWCPTSRACSVDWVKVPAGVTRTRIQSANLEECVRYTISIYACTSRAPQLLDRREGYVKECLPQAPTAEFKATQNESHVCLSWIPGPPEKQTAFIHRYVLTYSDDTETINVNTADAVENSLTISLNDLPGKSYQFTLKAVTSVGTTNGKTITVNLNMQSDQTIGVMMLSFGAFLLFFSFSTIVCYKNRRRLKHEFYPEIPKPELKPDWLMTGKAYGGQLVQVEPCQNAQLDISPVKISQSQEEEEEPSGVFGSAHLPRTTSKASSSSSEAQYREVDFANPSYSSLTFPAAGIELCDDYQPHTGLHLVPSPQGVSTRGDLVFPVVQMELCEDYQLHTGLLLDPSPQEGSVREEFGGYRVQR